MGAWIETLIVTEEPVALATLLPLWEHGLKLPIVPDKTIGDKVAPFMGAWIETQDFADVSNVDDCCSLYGSMD